MIAICGVKLNTKIIDDKLAAIISIEGDIWAEDIRLTAYHLMPNLDELIDMNPIWQSNVFGIMQIVTLMEIDNTLNKLYCK